MLNDTPWTAALQGLGLTAALFVTIWLASLGRRDASLVDRFWGLGFVLLAWFYWWRAGMPVGGLAALGAVTLWGLRLSVYLSWRNWSRGEDPRYADMRRRHGAAFPLLSLGSVFLLQALILWIVAFPLLPATARQGPALPPDPWLLAGLAIWAVGLFFETVGDWQLARFKADPANRGRVLDRGLWRYTRHPNYFGDICVWWGLYLMAVPAGGGWTLFAPALMSFLLARVSGVTLLEKKLSDSRPGYRDYVRRTNALIPGPPRRGQKNARGGGRA